MSSNRAHERFATILVLVAAGCGLDSSVVGGRCRDGLVLEGSSCVPPTPSVTLITPTDPPPPTAATGGVDGSAAVAPPVVIPPSTSPASPTDDPPETPSWLPPVGPQPPACTLPLVLCRDVCISVASDPANCGACGKNCPSNICVAGECQGETPGDVVLIGHDYATVLYGSSQAKVLANALTIPTSDPIRILAFEDGASPGAMAQVIAIAAGDLRGRKASIVRAPSARTLESSTLAQSYDVVLIHDAIAVDPLVTGARWSSSLGGFTSKGGVVIALDRGTSRMPELLTAAGLLAVGSHTKLPVRSHLVVSAAADVIGAQVVSPYAAFGAPVTFQGLPAPDANLTWVVRQELSGGSAGDPVVVHRVVR